MSSRGGEAPAVSIPSVEFNIIKEIRYFKYFISFFLGKQ